jgi:hypothetical protein
MRSNFGIRDKMEKPLTPQILFSVIINRGYYKLVLTKKASTLAASSANVEQHASPTSSLGQLKSTSDGNISLNLLYTCVFVK